MISSHIEITKKVTDLCRWTCQDGQAKIDPGMSLTQDLGFDSVKLIQFFADIEELFPGLALEEWFNHHCLSGQDTINSIVYYLTNALAPAVAK